MQNVFTTVDYAPVLIDSMMDMVRVVRADGSVAIVNDAMRKYFGEVSGSACYESIGCEKKCPDCMMERLKNGEKVVTRERSINGRSFSLKSSPMFDKDNNFIGAVEVFRDITDEVALRNRLIKVNNKLLDDLSMVRLMQRSIFRKRFPNIGNFRFSMGFYPCEAVGGDACDCIPLEDGKVLMYVADVSGHGVRAAMLTVFLRQEIIMLARRTGTIDLKEMLSCIKASFKDLNVGENTYITIFMAILDTATGEMRCINAGHSVAPLIKHGGEVHEIFLPGPPICAWSEHAGGKESTYKLEENDRLLMYTDGMLDIDRKDPETRIIKMLNKEPFFASEFIQEFRKLHAKNPVDDLLMFICQRVKD